MTTENQQHIYIFDHPESRVHFLEATLDGKDWRATIVYPDATAESQQKLIATRSTLEKSGYVVQAGHDAYGHTTLDIHHLGLGVTPPELCRELGLGRGVLHTLTHPAMSLGEYLHRGEHALKAGGKYIWDPARANGMFYIAAETFLLRAGTGNKHGKITDLKNFLHSFGYALFWCQSMIYAVFARSNDELALKSIQKHVDGVKAGKVDFERIRYDATEDAPKPGIGHGIMRFVRRYPIQIGALFNDLGMLAYVGHAFYERADWKKRLPLLALDDPKRLTGLRYINRGFFFDIGSTIASITAWGILCLKPKERPENKDPAAASLWERFRENPQAVSAGLTVASSSQRIIGGITKGNKLQTIGESVYLPGDFLLFFTKNDAYGSDKIKDVAGIAQLTANYINGLPIVLGAQSQHSTVQSIANYLTDKRINTLAHDGKLTPEMRDRLQEHCQAIVRETLGKIAPEQNARLIHVGYIADRIIQRFPESVHGELEGRLAEAMCKMPWLQASTDELRHIMRNFPPSPEALPLQAPKLTGQQQSVRMKDIAADIATLMEVVPDVDRVASANALYEAFTPYLHVAYDKPPAATSHIPQSIIHNGHIETRLTPSPAESIVRIV